MKNIQLVSTYPPALVKRNGWTRIVAGSIESVNGEKWSHPFVAVKGEKITSADITWKRSQAPQMKPSVKKVAGSSGRVYTVTTLQNGLKTCTCPGYQYRRVCKHLGK